DLWGLREDEVTGKQFLALDIGLPVEKLKQPIKACLGGTKDYAEVELEATNRRGRAIRCRVTCMPLIGRSKTPRGVIAIMEDVAEANDAPRARNGAKERPVS